MYCPRLEQPQVPELVPLSFVCRLPGQYPAIPETGKHSISAATKEN
jgi:hypothetical protein